MKIFGPKRDEVVGIFTIGLLPNKEVDNLYVYKT
jgi:hypothetical protein